MVGMANTNKTVFIIEDELDLVKVYQITLKDLYNVVIGATKEEIFRVLQANTPVDLILLDLELPGTSGIEILRHINQSEYWKQVPVVAMSNMSNQEIVEYTLGLGAKEFIVKSNFEIFQLPALVGKYVGVVMQ